MNGSATLFAEIARSEDLAGKYVRSLAPLTFLSPRIVEAILDGNVRAGLTLDELTRSMPSYIARVGLKYERIIYCETWKDAEVLPAMEEGLRYKGFAGVVGELSRLPLTASRRLQLAAEKSGVTAFAIRRTSAKRDEANAAFSRWRIGAEPSAKSGRGFPSSVSGSSTRNAQREELLQFKSTTSLPTDVRSSTCAMATGAFSQANRPDMTGLSLPCR